MIVYGRPGWIWEIPFISQINHFSLFGVCKNIFKMSFSFYLINFSRKKLKKVEKSVFKKKQKIIN